MNSKPLTVEVESADTAKIGVVDLLQAVTFGTDGLRYQRLEVQSQLDRFNRPRFFHALADGVLIGVYVLDYRHLLVDGQSVNGYYRGALAVDDQWQGRGVGKALTKSARQWLKTQSQDKPVYSYGCIDQQNRRSLKLLESGGAILGPALSMYMMYRQWPAVCCDLQPIESHQHELLSSMKEELYGQCRVRDVSPSALPGYVLQDQTGVSVSARVTMTSFRITNMSRLASLCTRWLVTPFAPARRRFNPSCFRYVCFTEVVIRDGCESQWTDFVSTVLARNHCHFGMVYVDTQSELFTRLQKSSLVNRWLHSKNGSINVVWQTFTKAGSSDLPLAGSVSPIQLWPVDA